MSEQGYLAESIAKFALDTSSFPDEALREGKRIILDQMACQIAAAPLPWSLAYLEAAKSFGRGDGASVVYFGDRLPLDQCVFVNGAFGQGTELDDVFPRASVHSGAVIVPIVLALAERHGINGKQALEAAIVGLEIIVRISTAAAPHLHDRGHHVPSAAGPFAAAAAASRIMGLPLEVCINAIAIGGSYATGLMEFTHTGGTVKRCHCGIAAMNGLRAAVMAAEGITGPHSVFEGGRGFFKTFAGQADPSIVTHGLGRDYMIPEFGYKRITSAYPAHSALEAIGELKDEYGLTPQDVATIDVGLSNYAYEHVGVIREPRDITEAHYSVAYGAAVRLFRGGNGFFDYRAEDLTDPKFRDLARRVNIYVDPTAEEERHRLASRTAAVAITTSDRRKLERRMLFPKGHPKNPVSDTELTDKFMSIVVPRLGEERAKRLSETVWAIEDLPKAAAILPLTLRPPEN